MQWNLGKLRGHVTSQRDADLGRKSTVMSTSVAVWRGQILNVAAYRFTEMTEDLQQLRTKVRVLEYAARHLDTS